LAFVLLVILALDLLSKVIWYIESGGIAALKMMSWIF